MVENRKQRGKAMSVPAGLAVGGLTSLGVTLGTGLALAWLIHGEHMEMENIGYGIMIMLLAASFSGAEVAYSRIRRQRMLVCVLSGAVYMGILLSMTALFFGGQYSGVGVSSLLILAGCVTAGLLGLRQGRAEGNHRHRHLRQKGIRKP